MFNTPKLHQAAPLKLNIYNLSLQNENYGANHQHERLSHQKEGQDC